MGFGLNVQLVFNSALNIVQLFTDAAVVTVVQHCYTLTHRSGVARSAKAYSCTSEGEIGVQEISGVKLF